ncbi:MAG TPA: BadF/BadG/BcrA/BcrD ATPase family protein [Candidatus Acidoferrales bacterium]|jgi:N-acetylglucosamine kinase-like BadF-type ATPase|nr:BadF/BadG/BcrA/BcrD ATPase family protein [Candidatus Acidoferrales bacterium]
MKRSLRAHRKKIPARALFLGFDGGGTKTECCLLDAEGRVLGKAKAGPANPLRVGWAITRKSLRTAARGALRSARARPQHVRGVCAGLAGAGRPSIARRAALLLQREFRNASVRATSDLEIALAAVAQKGPAVVIVAGTGSAAHGRGAKGATARAGGLGPRLGDEGSAFDIGRQALTAVLSAKSGRGPSTTLLEKKMGSRRLHKWAELVQSGAELPDAVFPKVFPLVVEAAEAGDSVAQKVLAAAAAALAELAAGVIRNLRLARADFPLGLSGGVFAASTSVSAAVKLRLRKIAPRARIGLLRTSPAEAAAQLARRAFFAAG